MKFSTECNKCHGGTNNPNGPCTCAKRFEELDYFPLSKRGQDWVKFSGVVERHIEEYTVPQYGDKGEDIASEYTAESCINQVKKYAARFGKNSRPGQERLDLLKMAHYVQMAFEALENTENDSETR